MNKPSIGDVQSLPSLIGQFIADIKENLLIITGQLGGVIAKPTEQVTPSAGIAVNSGTATLVTLKTEFDQLVMKVGNIETALNALIDRLNTP